MTEERINSIRGLLKSQEYELAEQQLEQYLQLEPGDCDAKILLGTCCMVQGNMEKAKALYASIQNHLKSEKSAKSSLLKLYLKMGIILFGSATLIACGLGACYFSAKNFAELSTSKNFAELSTSKNFAELSTSIVCKYAGPPVDYYCSVCGEKTSIGWGWIDDQNLREELQDKVDRGLIPCKKCKKDTPFMPDPSTTPWDKYGHEF